VNKQTQAQILDQNTYSYVRLSVLCQTNKANGWITRINPIASPIRPYNLTKSDSVNTVPFTGQCGISRSLRSRSTEETLVFDVDINIELAETLGKSESSLLLSVGAWIGIALAGFAIAALIVVVTLNKHKLRAKKRVTRVNSVNPLNNIPVVVPWATRMNPWSLRDTLPTSREEFSPLSVRR